MPAISGTGFLLVLTLALLLLSGCSAKQQWVHPDKKQDAFYRDDAKCLEFSNKVLFEQLQEISPQQAAANGSAGRNNKSICILPDAGLKIHQQCMGELGWKLK
jgi:uncharacterized protein YcfL